MPKPALVFLHGFRGSSLGLKQLAGFFDDYSVFIPDLPPAGHQKLTHYNADHYVAWLKSYLKNNHIDHPILIGHSMGSTIAAAFASRHPELINPHLIFLAPISKSPSPVFLPLQPLELIIPSRLISYFVTKYLFVSKDRILFKTSLHLTNLCTTTFSSKLDLVRSGFFANRHSIADYKLPSNLQPHFIAGEHDLLVSRQATRNLCRKLSIKPKFISDTGHLLNYENPALVAEAIRAAIESN